MDKFETNWENGTYSDWLDVEKGSKEEANVKNSQIFTCATWIGKVLFTDAEKDWNKVGGEKNKEISLDMLSRGTWETSKC